MNGESPARRRADTWFGFLTQFWDWVDDRDIDKQIISIVILYGTWELTQWAMRFSEHGDRPGLEIAAIIGAVTGPYALLQGAAIKFYFDARKDVDIRRAPPPRRMSDRNSSGIRPGEAAG
jgi:hypothetical protein